MSLSMKVYFFVKSTLKLVSYLIQLSSKNSLYKVITCIKNFFNKTRRNKKNLKAYM